ncbi:MAG: cyclase family protein [Burkholderiales bacterium]|nr:cyclase family protein [Burkholderiales bacterium]
MDSGAAPKGTNQPTRTGALEFYNLSHRWAHGMPEWPSSAILNVKTVFFHAKEGVQVKEIETTMHRGTHMDAPIHVEEDTPTLTNYPLWRFFGTGVAVSIPKKKWEVVTPKDLENATPRIRKGDILMINTGSHHDYGDTPEYFCYGPGLYKDAAQWCVDHEVKMVGIDVQALDHPLGTKLVSHGVGPSHPWLEKEYKEYTGRNVLDDFPYWEPAHRVLMCNGIPGIENIGGDLDKITGKRCTFMAFPWRWTEGCGSGVRVIALLDPKQQFRIETGR